MDLKQIRSEIDIIDEELLRLFLKRTELSCSVAEYKRANGLPILNRTREREVLAEVTAGAGEDGALAHRLFTVLMELSKTKQSRLIGKKSKLIEMLSSKIHSERDAFPKICTAAVQGCEGSNSQSACEKMIPMGNMMLFGTFDAVCRAVKQGLCEFGVLPIENSVNGTVRKVYELIRENGLYIVKSENMLIKHELLVKNETPLSRIKTIYSHWQALGQCGKFLSELKDVTIVPCSDTAAAAKLVSASEDPSCAAIASHACAEIYGLCTAAENIGDNDNNYTRFVCVGKELKIFSGAQRTGMIITLENKPGALESVMSKIAAANIDIAKLESYPISGSDFEYRFFIELKTDINDEDTLMLLSEIENESTDFAFLGSY